MRECLSLTKSFVQAKGILQEEYEAVAPELYKIFSFAKENDRLNIVGDILEIGVSVLEASGTHLEILNPLITSLGGLYSGDTSNFVEVYQIMYTYLAKDNQFFSNLTPSDHSTQLYSDTLFNKKPTTSSGDTGKQNPNHADPFKEINLILTDILSKASKDFTRVKTDILLRTLLLLVLEMQKGNNLGLIPLFKEIMDHLSKIYSQSRTLLNFDNFDQQAYLVYVWVNLCHLNCIHYFYEELGDKSIGQGQDFSQSFVYQFAKEFLQNGLKLLADVFEGLNETLKGIFKVGCIKILDRYRELGLEAKEVLFLTDMLAQILASELDSTVDHKEETLIGKKKLSKKRPKLTTEISNSNSLGSNLIATQLSEVHTLLRLVPPHEPRDFYTTTINYYNHFQQTIKRIEESDGQFKDFLKKELSPASAKCLNDVMSVMMTSHTTRLVSLPQGGHEFKEKAMGGFVARKIAKVVRRPGGQGNSG